MAHTQAPEGPDFASGIGINSIEDGAILRGNVRGTPALAIRRDGTFRFVGATCTHYGLPLEGGLIEGEQLRCPFHHARFCLKSGAAIGAPALDPIGAWEANVEGDIVRAGSKIADAVVPIAIHGRPSMDENDVNATSRLGVLIVGGGAAGHAAAEMLRAEGHEGAITLISEDNDIPYDRPKCSKALLAGQAKPEALFWRDREFYKTRGIELLTGLAVKQIDTARKMVTTADDRRFAYDRLILAMGAAPKHLDVPGGTGSNVHYLRSLADARALAGVAKEAKRAVVVGASFIGLEAAASLRMRGLEVYVVSPAPLPMEKRLGKPLSDKLRAVHEEHGVRFRVGGEVIAIDEKGVRLSDGTHLDADLVVVGIGVSPRVELARASGLRVEEGVCVDEMLRTSDPHIYAAGDMAQWPNPFDGSPLRIEHWVVAQRQGQAVARTILGATEPFRQSPFFWSIQFDFGIGYIGHVDRWDRTEEEGDLEGKEWSMTFFQDGEPRAMAIVSRNLAGLEMEAVLEMRMHGLSGH